MCFFSLYERTSRVLYLSHGKDKNYRDMTNFTSQFKFHNSSFILNIVLNINKEKNLTSHDHLESLAYL